MAKFRTVDEYVAAQPEAVRPVVDRIRRAIRKAIPDADETIAYDMPAYKRDGETVVHFAVWKKHYSLFGATPAIVAAFENELRPYDIEKGTIRFSLSEPVPEGLIERIVAFRANER